jgi:dTDP-4-amino-4,6-dideoxygalactose transaminase
MRFPFYNQKIKIGDLFGCLFVNNAKQKLLSFLQEYFKNENIFLLKSGRQGIKIVLENLDLKERNEVIVPAFICPAVVEAVQRAGGQPIFSEVEKQGFNLDIENVRNLISSRTRAILLPHLFGITAKLDEFSELAKEHNIALIEDCAHALGARYKGKLVGTFADFSIFTFGFSKNVGGLGGGFILLKNKSDFENIKRNISQKSSFSIKQYLELFLTPFVFNKYLYFLFANLVEKYGKRRQRTENEREFSDSISDLEAKVALKKLGRYEVDQEKRNRVSLIYQRELKDLFSFPKVIPDTKPAYLSLPAFASNDIFLILKKDNLPVQQVEFGKPGEKFPDNYFLLPLDYSLKDVEMICQLIKKKLKK